MRGDFCGRNELRPGAGCSCSFLCRDWDFNGESVEEAKLVCKMEELQDVGISLQGAQQEDLRRSMTGEGV